MKIHISYFLLIAILVACKSKSESVSPTVGPITESVYASGTIESDDQYQVFPSVNGIIQNIYISEGDNVNINSKLFSNFPAIFIRAGISIGSSELSFIRSLCPEIRTDRIS